MRDPTSRRLLLGVTDSVSLTLLAGLPAHLSSEGWEVHVVANEVRPVPGAYAHAIDMTRRISPLRDLAGLWRWCTLIHRLKPDSVMVGTPKAGLLGIVASWCMRVESRIYLLRGLRLETAHGLERRILVLAERCCLALATDVLAVSPSLARRAEELGLVQPGRMRVLGSGSSNGVDTQRFQPPTPQQIRSAKRVLGLATDRFVVGYVGRVNEDKGLDTLVAALQRQPCTSELSMVIAGPVEDKALAARMRASLEAAGVDLVELGHVEEMSVVYHAMDVLCLPSLREGFPNVVIEAAACGIPAITSDATGCVDSVVDGVTGWMFPRGDDSGLAACLLESRAQTDARHARGHNARSRVVQEFERSLVWQRLSAYCTERVAKPGRSGITFRSSGAA